MNKYFLSTTIALLLVSTQLHSETIRQVIIRSDKQLVDSLVPIDLTSVANIANAFNTLNKRPDVKLIVSDIPQLVYSDFNTVYIDKSVNEFSNLARLFIVAHELSHINFQHYESRIRLWEKYLPGDVTPEAVAEANRAVGLDFKHHAYNGEYQADMAALLQLMELGFSKEDIVTAFMSLPKYPDTATHPSSMKRMLNLRFQSQ